MTGRLAKAGQLKTGLIALAILVGVGLAMEGVEALSRVVLRERDARSY
jgi:hypothetical protein